MSARDSRKTLSSSSKNIVFFHPDLGIGGAERLIIDAAVGLKERGHRVVIYTSYCDKTHCFDEARDGTLDVRVRAPFWLPSSFFGRFHILLATLRQLYLFVTISLPSFRRGQPSELASLHPHVFFVDQLSACLPLLRWMWPAQRTLFYCHFPDQLLAQNEKNGILWLPKAIYRYLFDSLEAWTMRAADKVVVNSKFTREVAYKTFGRNFTAGSGVDVIYPCVDTTNPPNSSSSLPNPTNSPSPSSKLFPSHTLFLSINRFESKKNISLAIHAFSLLLSSQPQPQAQPNPPPPPPRLILAGGYDPHLPANKAYYTSLLTLCDRLHLTHATARTLPTLLLIPFHIQVIFLLSIPSSLKTTLLASANLLLYTPENEHFGIVPVEAMFARLPVLAADTGGPLETVVEAEKEEEEAAGTGWLRNAASPEEWMAVMRRVMEWGGTEEGRKRLEGMGKRGRERVEKEFSRERMAGRLDDAIKELLSGGENKGRKEFVEWRDLLLGLGVVVAAVVGGLFFGARRWATTAAARNRDREPLFLNSDRARMYSEGEI